MKRRVAFLLIILIFRFSLGWLEVRHFRSNSLIKVSGNIDNIYQIDSKCIIQVGMFWMDSRNDCFFSRSSKIVSSGRVKRGLIDNILGRIWLDSAEIAVLDYGDTSDNPKSTNREFLSTIRENIVTVYRKYLPEPESGVIAGIILGYKNDIGPEIYQQMINSGTVHIVVASGYNVMLVGGLVLCLCYWFMKRKWATMVSVLIMVIYALEAGGDPPVVRAVIMGAVVYLSACLGRKTRSWWLLLVTGWLMVLLEPWLLLSVSFQLSMAASVGLMVVEPKVTELVGRNHEKLINLFGSLGLTTSVSTMVMTLPVIWWHFKRVSLIGIVSNSLILPMIPMTMLFGALMQIFPGIFVWPTYALAHWIVVIIRFFGG